MTKQRKPRTIIKYLVPTIGGCYVPVVKQVYLELISRFSCTGKYKEIKHEIKPNYYRYYFTTV